MDPNARRGYRMLATLFLLVGGAFAVLALVQRLGGRRWFNGDPLGIALLVLVIGGALWWTVRSAPDAPPGDEAPSEPESADDRGAGGTPPADPDGGAPGPRPGPRPRDER